MAAATPSAAADSAGTVTYLSGTLSVVRSDGSARILSQKSAISPGDLLSTERDSYAQINFSDGSSATLRPNSRMRIEEYRFAKEEPQRDGLFMRLLRGGMRTVTGLIGKRGNMDAYRIGTSTATIGIRGSSGDTLECSSGCAGVVPEGENLDPGTYHTTYTGSYVLTNEAGSQVVAENQFAFVADANSAPQLLPGDPGLNLQQLPFTLGVGGGPAPGGTAPECVVR